MTRAEGGFASGDKRYKLVDLPGTYSLLSSSLDEEVARDFLLFGQPDVTVVVVDATCLERNLNLVLQVLEITNRAVVCLNLMDEARRRGIEVDARRLARDLGVRVVPTAARYNEGLPELMQAIAEVARGEVSGAPHRVGEQSPALQRAVERLCDGGAASCIRSCPTRSGWPCGCSTATSASSRRCGPASSAISIRPPTRRRRRPRRVPRPRRCRTPWPWTPCSNWRRSCAGRSAPSSTSR